MGKLRTFSLFLALTTTIAHAQTVYNGTDVQDQINSAVLAGQSTFTLPPGVINLSNSLIIPAGTRNFLLQGQSGTRLVRNSASDFPLIAVGICGWHAFLNSAFSGNAQTSLSPVNEGDLTVTTTSGAALAPGWYALLSTDPLNDIVTHVSGNTTFNYRRELVRIRSVSGNTAILDHPVGRSFPTAELRRLELDGAPWNQRAICSGITLKNLVLDGKSTVNNGRCSKAVTIGLSNDVYIDDVSISNYSSAGVSVLFSKGINVTKARVNNISLDATGYGFEFVGSRFITVRNSTFTNARTGILFQAGSMDGLVEDTTGPQTNFDASHGMGELRITYRRCLGDSISVGNPSWRRGVDRVLIEDCTATREMRIYGGTSNVVVRGRYPGQINTTPVFLLYSESGGSAVPSTPSYPISLTLENGVSQRSDLDGVNLRQTSVYGSPKMLGNLTIRNWTFVNSVSAGGSNLSFNEIANSPTITVENCRLTNSYQWSAPIYLGPTSSGNSWNLTLRDNQFFPAGTSALMLDTASIVNWANQSNWINQQPVTAANVRGAQGLRPLN